MQAPSQGQVRPQVALTWGMQAPSQGQVRLLGPDLGLTWASPGPDLALTWASLGLVSTKNPSQAQVKPGLALTWGMQAPSEGQGRPQVALTWGMHAPSQGQVRLLGPDLGLTWG